MNDSTNQPRVEKQQESLRPYAITGVVLLLVFVTAILMPDYFNYKLRLARIEAGSKMSAANPKPSKNHLTLSTANTGLKASN
jgi:hypothetical protein